MTGVDDPISQHPVDRLIRALIGAGRAATPDDAGRIVARMATVPFDPRVVRVKAEHRGLSYQGQRPDARADALTYHLAQRVVLDEQWVRGTTAQQYVADLRQAVCSATARLIVFERRGGFIAATITETDRVISAERQGPSVLSNLLVVYSADRGTILTGYQFSTLTQTGIPRGARWLK